MPAIDRASKRAPISLLLFSNPPRESPSVAKTTAAVTGAHALVLAAIFATALLLQKPDLPSALNDMSQALDVDFTMLLMGTGELRAAPEAGRPAVARQRARSRPTAETSAPQLLGQPVLLDVPTVVPRTIPEPPQRPGWSPRVDPAAGPPLPAATPPRGAEPNGRAAGALNSSANGNGGNSADVESLTLDELAREPRFTPFTQAPELINRAEVKAFLQTRYSPIVSGRGIGGRAVLWLLIDLKGDIRKAVLLRSSGYSSLDDAALEAIDRMEFRPAINKGRRVNVWVQLPISFQPDW
ncbi:MAG: energy transducer TonB [Longimicrobiales bacterium]